MRKYLTRAAMVALTLSTVPALADPMIVGVPAQPKIITTEQQFAQAYPAAARNEQMAMTQMFASKTNQREWQVVIPMGNPGKADGILTISDRDGNCATVRNEMKIPALGAWTYRVCQLQNGQFSIE